MKILFDQGVPEPLRRALAGHDVHTAVEMGWSSLSNGDLLDSASGQSFDVFVTTDQNLRHQQNLTGRSLSILVLMTTSWPQIRPKSDTVLRAVEALRPGEYRELSFAP